MTREDELGSQLRRLGEAVTPADGFADRVAAGVASLPRPTPRRPRRLAVPLAAAVALLVVGMPLALVVARRPVPPAVTAAGGDAASGREGQPAVAFSLTALAYVNSKWGFIDRTGAVVVPARYSRVGDFSEGVAPVKVGGTHAAGGKWGYVDRAGKEVIEPRFDWAFPFREGLAGVKLGDKYGFIDRTGAVVVEPRFEQVERFAAGLAPVREDGKWGFIGADGKYRVEPRFGWVASFSEGLAAVSPVAEGGAEPTVGFIDPSGAYRIKPRFDSAGAFHEGLAAVRQGGLWGFVDRTGRIVIEPKYASASGIQGGRALVRKLKPVRGGKNDGRTVRVAGALAPDGQELTPFTPDYDSGILIDPKTGRLSARVTDEQGEEKDVTDVDLAGVPDQDGLVRVGASRAAAGMTYHTYGFVDRSGRVVVAPTLEEVEEFHEGLAAFATGLDWKAVADALKNQGGP